jgi:DNA-binding NtrC family response regulator
VLARWLHGLGPRSDDAFVDLNCAGLSAELLDSELFGHERGAFTTAVRAKEGLLEVANGGTLFLDEIGDMDVQVQAKLLKVLEEQRFRRVGDVRDRAVNVRLIAATHQDLPEAVKTGRFRRDLYYRINTIQLHVPPLRERGEDILRLADDLLARLGADLGRASRRLGDAAREALLAYPWPGNVRELRNVLERAVLLSDNDVLDRRDLRFESADAPARGPSLDVTLRDLEVEHIKRVLEAERGRIPAAAERLGVPKSSLYQKLKTYGIDPATFRR